MLVIGIKLYRVQVPSVIAFSTSLNIEYIFFLISNSFLKDFPRILPSLLSFQLCVPDVLCVCNRYLPTLPDPVVLLRVQYLSVTLHMSMMASSIPLLLV